MRFMKNKKIKLLLGSLTTLSATFGTIYSISHSANFNHDNVATSSLDTDIDTFKLTSSVSNGDGIDVFSQFVSGTNIGGSVRYQTLQYKKDGDPAEKSYVIITGSENVTGSTISFNSEVVLAGKSYKLLGIGDSAFANNTVISGAISLPEGLTSIGGGAFYGCTGITSVTLPKTLKSIGTHAFYQCTNLTGTIALGSSKVSLIGDYAFKSTKITTLTLPDKLDLIGKQAFYSCTSLAGDIQIGASKIGDSAFEGCNRIRGLDLNNAKEIGKRAFYGCTAATSQLSLPDIEKIGESAFYNCSGLTSLKITSSKLTEISNEAFYNCSGLTGEIDLACFDSGAPTTKITKIGDSAFSGCSKITKVILPNKLETIEKSAFYNCTSLVTVTSNSTGTDLYFPSGLKTISEKAFENCSKLKGKVFIPNSVTRIKDLAFKGCTLLEGKTTQGVLYSSISETNPSAYNAWCIGMCGATLTGDVVIKHPNSTEGNLIPIYGIAGGAFMNSTALANFSLAEAGEIKVIDNYAFSGCTALKQAGTSNVLAFGNKLETLGSYAFQSCSTITGYVNLPYTLKEVGVLPFFGCSGLNNPTYCKNGILYSNGTSFEQSQYAQWCLGKITNNVGNAGFTLRNNTIGIAGGAFKDIKTFTGSISFDNDLKYIGDSAFENCTSLYGFSFVIDPGKQPALEIIGDSAFASCTGLGGVLKLPESLTKIGAHAFDGCSQVAGSIDIGSNVTSIGEYAFKNCSSLNGSLNFTNSDLSNLTRIEKGTFLNCSSLGSKDEQGITSLPRKVTLIDDEAFAGCTSLKGELNLPEFLETVGVQAFKGCTGFTGTFNTSGTAPLNLKYIGDEAFAGCTNITGNISLSEGLEMIGASAFNGCGGCHTEGTTHTKATLTFPASLKFINDHAFADTEFSTIIFNGETAPKMGYQWNPKLCEDGRIIIPANSKDSYFESNVNINIDDVGTKDLTKMTLDDSKLFDFLSNSNNDYENRKWVIGKSRSINDQENKRVIVKTDGGDSKECTWELWDAQQDKEFDKNKAPWLKIDPATGVIYCEANQETQVLGSYQFRIKAQTKSTTPEGNKLSDITRVMQIDVVATMKPQSADATFWVILSISIAIPSILVAMFIFWLTYKVRIRKQKELKANSKK